MTLPTTEQNVLELKSAYYLLEVPFESSAPVIKRAYWRLAKRFHPDKWPPDSPPQARATEKMKQLNEAYSRIKHAPLRYHIDAFPKVKSRYESARHEDAAAQTPPRETIPVTDIMEMGVRFVFGAIFGAFIALRLYLYELPVIFLLLPIFICGILAVRFGDHFWHRVLGWVWWL